MTDELIRFVREALSHGVSKPDIRARLLDARWPEDEVNNALDAYADIDFPVPIPRPQQYLSAREAFLYLALFSTLYVSAFSLGSLLYQFINQTIPDPATLGMAAAQLGAVRWATSSLIIAFPVFVILSRTMYKAIRKDPEKRTSKIRKWLTYLTLFVAGGVILGDLISLVFNLLGGELTTRFLLKVSTVGGIAGSIFGYYLWDLRQADADPDSWVPRHAGLRVFVALVIMMVGASIVGGLLLAGSPAKTRQTKLDDQRQVDLQMISTAVDVYWSQNRQLPGDLEQLSRERAARLRSIHDPQTGELYEYRVTGDSSYELCAIFDTWDLSADERNRTGPYATGARFWTHGPGRGCFPVEARKLPRVVVEPEPTLEETGGEPDTRD